MAIKGGDLLHVGNDTTLIERLQTGGPGQLSIPTEKIYELGNYESVATVRDTPDLQYSLESLDVTPALEALLTGVKPADYAAATSFDLSTVTAIDLLAPLKPGKERPAPFDVTQSVAVPFLTPESIQYRFGLRDNAAQTVSLRGDSIFYNPGPSYVQSAVGTATAGQTVVTANPAGIYTDSQGARRILSVSVDNERLTYGVDYTLSATSDTDDFSVTTVTIRDAVPTTSTIRVTYFSDTTREYPQSIHTPATVKPAAIRGRDIDVYVGGYDPTATTQAQIDANLANKWGTVQSVQVNWRVTIDKDEEFGNYFAYGQDFDVPTVDGQVTVKPRNPAELFTKLRQMSGVTNAKHAIGPNLAEPLPLDIVLKNPVDGATLKRLHIDDARFTIPGFSGRVQTKQTFDIPLESDSGKLEVFKI